MLKQIKKDKLIFEKRGKRRMAPSKSDPLLASLDALIAEADHHLNTYRQRTPSVEGKRHFLLAPLQEEEDGAADSVSSEVTSSTDTSMEEEEDSVFEGPDFVDQMPLMMFSQSKTDSMKTSCGRRSVSKSFLQKLDKLDKSTNTEGEFEDAEIDGSDMEEQNCRNQLFPSDNNTNVKTQEAIEKKVTIASSEIDSKPISSVIANASRTKGKLLSEVGDAFTKDSLTTLELLSVMRSEFSFEPYSMIAAKNSSTFTNKDNRPLSKTVTIDTCRRLMDSMTTFEEEALVKVQELGNMADRILLLSEVVGWLTVEGEQVLSLHADVADNLRAVRQQQKEFDKLYFAAMTHIEKGNDMLEEASLLTQSGQFEDVTGIKEITHELKTRVRSFTSRLDELKDKISNTAQCYHLLDKSYEWALDAMKYVASMKMETAATPAGLDKITSSLDLYLKEHPPIPDATFDSMLELAQQLENDKLQEQCRVAHARCHETSSLLRQRQVALRRARGRLEKEERRRASLVSAMSHSGFGPDLQEPCWQPQTDLAYSVQSMMALRRRSYAGQASAPMYSPQAQAFRDGVRDTNLSEYEEQFFREGLITEDMSDRIVTSLPASGSVGLRTSMDSLRASKESLHGSSENLSREQKSSSLPREMSGLNAQSPAGDGQTQPLAEPVVVLPGRRGSQPKKKLMRRMNSVLTGADGEVLDHHAGTDSRKDKTLSLISGSSESLPSMPEEEEGAEDQQDGQAMISGPERKFVWSPVPANTTLARQTRTLTSYHSMADLRLTDEEMKRRRTLELIMNEMIQTERNYVKSLGYVIDHYLPELLREDVPQPLRGKRNVIFGNLEQIHTFHSQYFLSALEQCEVTPFQICHCFLQHAQEFYLYALYNKNKPKSDELMSEYGSKFFKRKQAELEDRMDLSSYLLKPVQRMGKYALLLKQILKECPESDQEHADLKSALEMVKFQLRHGNDLLVMDSLRECDVNLQEQGRLLRQDEFLVWTGRKKSLRRVFLFEELILFSKTRRSTNGHDVYIYKNSMKTADIGLTENVGESQYKFEIWFRRRTDGATRTLQAPNMDIKAAWVREISRLLWKQAIKNRELRLQEMARMGIGSKPCLDLKQSKDNIKDRFVNVNTANRVPRSRNSVAVSSFEHLKNGTKRPHSIISVSSTSSSNSSHSSGPGLFSVLGSTAETTVESPQRNSKSYTICSNVITRSVAKSRAILCRTPLPWRRNSTESGIVADMGSGTPPSSSAMTDSCTQTTLKRPPRPRRPPSSSNSSSSADAVSLTAAATGTGTETSSHMLSTDV